MIRELSLDEIAERATAVLAAQSPTARASSVAKLLGGASSFTYSIDIEDQGEYRRAVVKTAVAGLAPVRNRDVLRQARLLKVIDTVPVPEVIGEDTGDPPDVPPLFIMSFVEGDSIEPRHDAVDTPLTAEQVRIRSLSAAALLADLQSTPIGGVVFADEPVVGLADEVERWERALATIDPDLLAGAEACHKLLTESVPAALPPTLVHGDWRLGNMLSSGNEIRSVIDWEIWSLGDPRIDLGWFLMMNHSDHPLVVAPGDGTPDEAELLDAYAARRGEPIPDLNWFHALVRYKQAAIAALIVKNARKRQLPDPSSVHAIPILLTWATELLGG
jgi:aminoglycoside phosphotransferase (APT) family kinase protein